MSEQRFDGIERSIDRLTSKVDDMAAVVTALARIEEKHVAVAGRLDHHDNRLNKHSNEIDDLNSAVSNNTTKADSSEWFIRLLIASAVGFIAYIARG
jgi:hypothetical protein